MSYGKMMTIRNHDHERDRGRERGGQRPWEGEMSHRGGEYYSQGEMSYRGNDSRDSNEMAFRDRSGRRHYDNGRFAPMRNEMSDDDDERGIGFMRGGEYPRAGWGMHQKDQGREMGRASVYERNGGGWVVQGQFGGKHHRDMEHMDESTAEEWTRQMRGSDGSTGAHWSMEQIKQLQQQKKELQEYRPAEVFAVMNMMYSDYLEVAKKFNVNNVDFYVCMTKAWLDDPDAGSGKTAKYYEYVVK